MKATPVNGSALAIMECAQILRQETALLERLAAAQEVVKNAVFTREWTDLESMLGRLEAYGQEFSTLERNRERIFTEAAQACGPEGKNGGFYALTTRLEPAERRELTELYRRLKLDTLKVRLANEALTYYLADARATVSGFLEAAFPDRKGRLYSRQGTQVHAEMRSIVLDRSF
jgi:hypothetical protein